MAAVQAVAVPVHCDMALPKLCDAQDSMRVPGRCRAKAPDRPCRPCAMHSPLSLREIPDGISLLSSCTFQLSATWSKLLNLLDSGIWLHRVPEVLQSDSTQ